MIFAVDDEEAYLVVIKQALEQVGFSVLTFSNAEGVLARAETQEPELIISDVKMPGMDGFDLRAALAERFPGRDTPFVFLSSLAEPDQVVRGLEAEVDDYLTKPIDPRILQAKVRILLQRKRGSGTPVFHGDLGRYPFIKVVQFCELQGLTGEVEFASGVLRMTIPFRAGNMVLDQVEDADDLLTRLYDLDNGSFAIRSVGIDFGKLSSVAVHSGDGTALPTPGSDRPMGRLSGVKVNDRLFQIQTEMVRHPEAGILTVVILDGNTVLKRHRMPPPSAARADHERLIHEQHTEVEQEVRLKVEEMLKSKAEGVPTTKERFYQLFEAGFERYREGKIAEALALWEEAKILNPEDTTLGINLKIARDKLAHHRN